MDYKNKDLEVIKKYPEVNSSNEYKRKLMRCNKCGVLILIVLLLIGGIIFYKVNKENSNVINDSIRLELIQLDNMDYSEKVVEEFYVQVNDIINLEKYNCNNVKILKITDEYVKISRKAVIMDYTKTIKEKVNYNTSINADIDKYDPSLAYDQSKYCYFIKFIK